MHSQLLPPSLALLLTACASVPNTPAHAPRITPPNRLDAAAANDAAITGTDRWWTAWGDPALDALVEKSLEANADIRAAKAHVAAARALVTVAESALYPTVAANGTAWASQSDAGIDDKWQAMLPSLSGNSGSGYLVGLGATWEADLFGGRHADAEMARALSESTARTADGVRLMVAADVVENYQQLQGLRRRLDVLDRSEATASRLVDYAAAGSGRAPRQRPMSPAPAMDWRRCAPPARPSHPSSMRASGDWPCWRATSPNRRRIWSPPPLLRRQMRPPGNFLPTFLIAGLMSRRDHGW